MNKYVLVFFKFPAEFDNYNSFFKSANDCLGKYTHYEFPEYNSYIWKMGAYNKELHINASKLNASKHVYVYLVVNGLAIEPNISFYLEDESVSDKIKDFFIYNLDLFRKSF